MGGQLTLSCASICHYYIFVEASNGDVWAGADHYLVDYSSYTDTAGNSSANISKRFYNAEILIEDLSVAKVEQKL